MICPDCGYDNIEGVDLCETCGQPLVDVGQTGSELEESISRHNIGVLPTKTPVSVSSTTSVREAVDEMISRKLGCVLVVDNEELVGIFTERDLLYKVSADLHELDLPVTDFMTPSPETITKQDSIAYALHAMDLGGYRHIPIVDSSESKLPIGIISIRDILRFLCIRFAKLRS
jgi:CBS domain-containing protein